MDNIFDKIREVGLKINNGRSISDIFTYAVEEIGELATEVNIEQGYSAKKPGKDGIVGESIDVIICLIDLIYTFNPGITIDDIESIVDKKLSKWLQVQAKV